MAYPSPSAPCLVWDWFGEDGEKPQECSLREGILEHFTRLERADPEAVLRFAQRYGVLMLCKNHRRPITHSFPRGPMTLKPPVCGPSKRESVRSWQRYAREARAILRLAAAAHQNEPGSPDDWRVIYGGPLRPTGWEASAETARVTVATRIGAWLEESMVQPDLVWSSSSPSIRIGGIGLCGAIATELAYKVARLPGLSLCAGCGDPFTPSRKPRQDRRSWCSECQEAGEPRRQAKRDARTRAKRG